MKESENALSDGFEANEPLLEPGESRVLFDQEWNEQKKLNHQHNLQGLTGWHRGQFYWRGIPQESKSPNASA